MDLKALRDRAITETGRYFAEKFGVAPAEDSDEWEAEYRRQFERLKKAAGTNPVAARPERILVEAAPANLPELSGAPADRRWAFALRAERLKQLKNREQRQWLARTWTKAKDWIEALELDSENFVRRVERLHATALKPRAAPGPAAPQLHGEAAAKLAELIDVSPRTMAAPVKEKFAELRLDGRTLGIYESANPEILMVLDKRSHRRDQYGIEHDEALVAALKQFAQSNK